MGMGMGKAVTALVAVAAAWAAPTASAETIYGLSDGKSIVQFDSSTPDAVSEPIAIDGLASGEKVKSIDVRPATLQLYALGSTGQLYQVDTVSGAATTVGDPLPVAGTDADIDFDPVFDRLRIVTDTDQNLRVNPNDGALVASDPPLSPAETVTGAAYNNNAPASASYPAVPASRLYLIDTTTDRLLVQQNPPNGGSLSNVGPLNVDLDGDAALDISTQSNAADGTPGPDTGYVVGHAKDGKSQFWTISLQDGGLSGGAEIAAAANVTDIAVAPPVPLLAVLIYGGPGGLDQQIATVRADRPGSPTAGKTIDGILIGEQLIGIDRRAADGLVYGLSDANNIYLINPATGVARPTTTNTFGSLNGSAFGVDFHPIQDYIRLVSTARTDNRRIDPGDASQHIDTPLSWAPGDPNANSTLHATGAAHTNPFIQASSTLLFDLETNHDVLALQQPPESGKVFTVGPLGVSATDQNGYDIVRRFNQGFAALQTSPGGSSSLYSVNSVITPTTSPFGSATRIGTLSVGTGRYVQGLSVMKDNALPESPTSTATPPPTSTPTASPTPGTTKPPKKQRPGLTIAVRPKRDRKAPFKVRVTGSIVRPDGVNSSEGCSGTVTVTVRKGSKRLAGRQLTLSSCRYVFQLKLKRKAAGKRGKAKITVAFSGNDRLLARTVTRKVRYGPAKKKPARKKHKKKK